MAKVVIAELELDITALLKSTSDLKKEIDALKNTQKDLAASGQSTSEAFIQNEAVLKTLNKTTVNDFGNDVDDRSGVKNMIRDIESALRGRGMSNDQLNQLK